MDSTNVEIPAIATKNKRLNPTSAVVLQNLSAAYEKDQNVLFNINAVINKGKITILTGHMGSGKSNILKLILGEMHITEGQLTANGTLAYVQ